MDESASLVDTLTGIKSKVDTFLKEMSNREPDTSLSSHAETEERKKEVLMRLEKALDDLSEVYHAPKVGVCVCFT